MPKKKAVSRNKYYSAKRRAVYAVGDDIDPVVLFELFGWICGICDSPINKYLRFPNYMSATVEHIMPISLGGTHTWDNVKPAHAICNWKQGNNFALTQIS